MKQIKAFTSSLVLVINVDKYYLDTYFTQDISSENTICHSEVRKNWEDFPVFAGSSKQCLLYIEKLRGDNIALTQNQA